MIFFCVCDFMIAEVYHKQTLKSVKVQKQSREGQFSLSQLVSWRASPQGIWRVSPNNPKPPQLHTHPSSARPWSPLLSGPTGRHGKLTGTWAGIVRESDVYVPLAVSSLESQLWSFDTPEHCNKLRRTEERSEGEKEGGRERVAVVCLLD